MYILIIAVCFVIHFEWASFNKKSDTSASKINKEIKSSSVFPKHQLNGIVNVLKKNCWNICIRLRRFMLRIFYTNYLTSLNVGG